MDLLGGYGDDDSGSGSEIEQAAAEVPSEQKENAGDEAGSKQGLNSLVGYLQNIGGEGDNDMSDESPVASKAPAGSKEGSKPREDNTPSMFPKRRGNLLLRPVSKSATPASSRSRPLPHSRARAPAAPRAPLRSSPASSSVGTPPPAPAPGRPPRATSPPAPRRA
jgi:hypothetical protein